MKGSLPLLALGSLLVFAPAMSAQFEIEGGTFNELHGDGLPFDADNDPPVLTPQFAGKAEAGASSGPIDTTPDDPNDAGNIATNYYDRYPAGQQKEGVTVVGGVVLQNSSFGGTFASGVPRYSMGDEIVRPELNAVAGGTVAPTYWRARPVDYDEVITQPGGTQVTPLPNPNAPAPAPIHTYYYSPHAKKVFAHQPGRVSITWMTALPVDGSGDPDPVGGAFAFKTEIFNVSSGTSRPVRRIYWTERSFNAPIVNIPTGRIVTVNPIYNASFPATVAEEYEPVGYVPPDDNASPPPELRTLWFDKTGGLGQLHAYNREGRLFVEYLGPLQQGGGSAVHEFLGADIVEVVQVAEPTTVTVHLGEQLQPHDPSGQVPGNADILLPSEVLNLAQDSVTYYGTSSRPDGRLIYHAEWENDNPDRVTFYWLEQQDVAIHFLEEPAAPQLDIAWPKFLNKYLQVWPDSITDFAGITVGEFGSTAGTGVQFSSGNIPEVIHQDDGGQSEVDIDLASQRLVTDFGSSTDRTNRTLLKFSDGSAVWYQRLFIQSESVLGSPGIPDPDGNGPLTATPAVATLADLDADGVRDLIDSTATVGRRIDRPGPQYEVAGYIAAGTGYHPGAYQDPLVAGVETAGSGAIIPVNAIPGENTFQIWWFEKVAPPVPGFGAFYVPSKSGQYTVSWPATSQATAPDQDQVILASNAGSGDLASWEAAGMIYVQNDPAQPGFNPNEEHALMLNGRAYALRDDLNVTSGAGYTSDPFVLLSHTDPDDGRPAVRTFEVLREVDQNDDDIEDPGDILFNYPVTAGATVPSPMPLPLLPLPLRPNGTVPNREVSAVPDPAPDGSAPLFYDEFTFQDRKGYTKVYRGPHAGGSPTMGMQFYYTMQVGFFVPGASPQPMEGDVLPYLRPLDGAGDPVGDPVDGTPQTIVYRPAWPAAVAELRIGETLTLPKFGLPQVRGQSSVEVLYQQSIALDGTARPSVALHDPTRAKTMVLNTAALEIMDDEIQTTLYNGRTYFQRLPPHLQQRVYANPVLGGQIELVLEGEFVDEIAGEDYLNLNVLSVEDIAALKDLDNDTSSAWDSAVDSLAAQVETFVENAAKKGDYIVGSSVEVGEDELAVISDSDTAVDSYALTATGQGTGYVTMLFGDGEAFTPEGDPVSIALIRVVPQLYVGDMKVQYSSNPLDEQVTLRHSGDFAAKPEDYEFEWRYASLVGGLPPATYEYNPPAAVLDDMTSWTLVQNPAGVLPTAAEYAEGASDSMPRTLTIQDENHAADSGLPGVVLRSDVDIDFTSGVPAQLIFSAHMSVALDGFVVYVNGSEAFAFRAPDPFANTSAEANLSGTGLAYQFELSRNLLTKGVNRVEVALYSTADPLVTSEVDFRLETVSRTDRVDDAVFPGSPWQHLPQQSGGASPNYPWANILTTGGSPTAPLGDPLLLLQDNSFTVRYRPKSGTGHVLEGAGWSDWMDAQVVPGWIKRVLDAINPYNQRVTDLFNNAINTDVSVLTQAGTRWEGDIALNLENVNEAGLIEIYETVLNRAKNFSIDNGYDVAGVNDALLLAAGYLNDLYILLGNEAYADAANPTISLDDQDTVTEVNTSRFSFEGQVASSLEEELSLYRGRDDFLATSVETAPAYNRLYWNYTNGVNSGEVLYAVNYNIKEKVGSATQDGVIDAADAQRMFPQAHGDAYGHYLTALKGYYRLLTNDNFTWTPRSEVVKVLGQNVSVDYFDERKFAGAAANLARSAEQILNLTWRQAYRDDELAGWGHFRDNKLNPRTNVRRQFGMDEWASRSTSGAYLHWLAGNAVLPEEDTNPQHEGVQVVDRQRVPELAELAAAGASLQAVMDSANAHLNPLGLSPDAVAFDISSADLKAGQSHFEQVYGRALTAVLNAKGSFDQAGRMTRLLRNQQNQIDDYNTTIEEQERAYKYKLIDIFGTPYSKDIGPGKTYAQGYDGPDLVNWFLIDEASDADLLELGGGLKTYEVPRPVDLDIPFGVDAVASYYDSLEGPQPKVEVFTVTVSPNRLAQVADQYFGGADATPGAAGEREATGEFQTALLEQREKQIQLLQALDDADDLRAKFRASKVLFDEMVRLHNARLEKREDNADAVYANAKLQKQLEATSHLAELLGDTLVDFGAVAAEFLPSNNGFSNDVTSPGRGAVQLVSAIGAAAERVLSYVALNQAGGLEAESIKSNLLLEKELDALQFEYEQKQFVYEFQLLLEDVIDQSFEIAARAEQYQRVTERVRNVLVRGNRVLAEREIFRLRAAAIIQGYRTRDVAFRAFRNEALEQYRTLFDLGARYTYLAAMSYDYETGLLGTPEGEAVINRIVASRALGDLTGGVPQATTSSLGDDGLAGAMAQLVADFSVAEGRLGINNPDQNGTLFSLRHELFRLPNDPDTTADDDQWQQTLEQHMVSDLMADADAAAYCRSLSNSNGGRVPGIIIPFSTTVKDGYNWFGLPLAGGDHAFSESNFATKIYSVGMVLRGYVGMDPYSFGTPDAGEQQTATPDSLSATPYAYLIPTGTDYMRAPSFGDTGVIRAWDVEDQALPLPYNLGATEFNGTQFFTANGTLSEQPWVIRKHQAFRPVDDPAFFFSRIPDEFVSKRLVGRSVWNSQWKIVIPAYTLLSDEEEGLERFARSVSDIQIFLRTYSNSGN